MSKEKTKKIVYSLDLKLSEDEYITAFNLAGSIQFSIENLLQKFIKDLIRDSNESHEMYVRNYLAKCWFGMFPAQTFLSYLIESGYIEDFINSNLNLRELENNLNEEDEEKYMDEIELHNECVRKYYDEYVECTKDPESYENGLAAVMAWWNDFPVYIEQKLHYLQAIHNEEISF